MSSRPRPRLPVWLLVLLALLVGLFAWLRLGDATGDSGMTNVFSFGVVLLGGLLVLGWFVLGSGLRARVRYGVLFGAALAVAAFLTLVRVERFSGSMVPVLRWRHAALAEPPPALPATPTRRVDLTATTPLDFPGFLGAARDARVRGVALARDWEATPPELVWRRRVGEGWSGFAVVAGVAITMEQRGDSEAVTAYDVQTGEPLWAHSWPGRAEHPLAGLGPHATPTVAGGRVFALGAAGKLVCLEGADGSLVWERDLLADFGTTAELEYERVQYGRSSSPLVAGGRVIVPVGGAPDAPGLVALDPGTGELQWASPPRNLSHASPTLATLAGVEQVLVVHEASVAGHDPATGSILWEHDWPGRSAADANNSQPVALPPDRVLVSKGYGAGAMVLALERGDGGELGAQPVWHVRRALRTKLTNVVVHQGHAYALSEGILECVDLADGSRAWKEGRYGHGQVLGVGELLLVTSEDGELSLVAATPSEPNQVLGRVQALDGQTWNTFALYGDLVVLRNSSEAAVYRLPVSQR